MSAATVMIQGTTSDAGKSVLVTALCRWLSRQGVRVAPFKPQNMALNSAVTLDGGEIGRAQAVQAYACGLEPRTDMNPVLLKPNSEIGAQVIIQGRAVGNLNAASYQGYKRIARSAVLDSYRRLAAEFDAVVVEGAGSPAEINLRENDIANMGFAESIDCPVVLVADIDRGGVFAHIVGTLALLEDSENARIRGFVINRFRGDYALLESGLRWLEERTSRPVLGVLPYLHGLHVAAEDALPREPAAAGGTGFRVVVPALPRISNHTDFDPLRFHPGVEVRFIGPDAAIPAAELIVLPGTKNVRDDLDWLRRQGWVSKLQHHLRYGGKLIGLCGGFQMLGRAIHDPDGVESTPGSSAGLGLLDMETTLGREKQLRRVRGKLLIGSVAIRGYEIHAGRTTGAALARPVVRDGARADGAISGDHQILGTYLHGLFDGDAARAALLSWAGLSDPPTYRYEAMRTAAIDRLADAVEEHLDTDKLWRLLDARAGVA